MGDPEEAIARMRARAEDVLRLRALEFVAVVRCTNEDPHCEAPAEWLARSTCGCHRLPVCDPCRQQAVDVMAARARLGRKTFCNRCAAALGLAFEPLGGSGA